MERLFQSWCGTDPFSEVLDLASAIVVSRFLATRMAVIAQYTVLGRWKPDFYAWTPCCSSVSPRALRCTRIDCMAAMSAWHRRSHASGEGRCCNDGAPRKIGESVLSKWRTWRQECPLWTDDSHASDNGSVATEGRR